ncbi:MAG: hypothetical protein JNK04_24890, partial [Myxococcales bacterium]|nr:hypothetical protein [Myxococcales bacterium]
MAGGCRQQAPTGVAVAPAKRTDPMALEGTWFIVASDLPTWTSPEKTSPALHYRLTSPVDGLAVLEDRATFIEHGKHAEYVGTDTQEAAGSLSFSWRGKGALSLLSTRWHLMHMAPDQSWAVAFYEKT